MKFVLFCFILLVEKRLLVSGYEFLTKTDQFLNILAWFDRRFENHWPIGLGVLVSEWQALRTMVMCNKLVYYRLESLKLRTG